MDIFIKAVGIILAVGGAVVVFGAKRIAKARGMAEKQIVNLETDQETLDKLKLQKALVKVKVIGGLIFLPGMLIILYAFR